MNREFVFAVDAGHGIRTPGKRSVDGSLIEGVKAREIAQGIVADLVEKGYNAFLVTPEDDDIPLSKRVARVNSVCRQVGYANVCCVSIHCDAQGYGNYWMPAQGWSARCSKGRKAASVSRASATLAGCIFDEVALIGRRMRTQYAGVKYWVQDLAICRDTLCAAVLTENFFMTNRDDLAFLQSEEGTRAIIDAHVRGLIHYAEIYA